MKSGVSLFFLDRGGRRLVQVVRKFVITQAISDRWYCFWKCVVASTFFVFKIVVVVVMRDVAVVSFVVFSFVSFLFSGSKEFFVFKMDVFFAHRTCKFQDFWSWKLQFSVNFSFSSFLSVLVGYWFGFRLVLLVAYLCVYVGVIKKRQLFWFWLQYFSFSYVFIQNDNCRRC